MKITTLTTYLVAPRWCFLRIDTDEGLIGYNTGPDLLDYLLDPAVFSHSDDGYIARLDGPGLGITIDERAVARAAEFGHRWRNPIWQRRDGSLDEW